MIFLLSKELPPSSTLSYFERIKLRIVFLNNAIDRPFHLVKRHFFVHECKSIVGKLQDLQRCKRFITGEDQGFEMRYEIVYFHSGVKLVIRVRLIKYVYSQHVKRVIFVKKSHLGQSFHFS